MDRIIVGLLVAGAILFILIGGIYLISDQRSPYEPGVPQTDGEIPSDAIQVVETDLNIPWGIEFLPDGDILVTERPGTLLRIDGETGQRYQISGVRHTDEGGLLGVEAHPNYAQNNRIYLYMTTQDPEGSGLVNRVVQYTVSENQLSDPETIISGIPGAQYHDGGRLAFGPDNKLYITTGDSGNPQLAQDRDALAGKILRVNADGSIPEDNPFGTPVYSYGHRNPQGLAWDTQEQLWSTEHGSTGRDEINRIQAGNNYGWPTIEGQQSRDGMESPVYASGRDTWAPASAAMVDGNLVFSGLRGESLYVAELSGDSVSEFRRYLKGDYGRLRAVELGPDGYLYVSTSNTDGRGVPKANSDRILRIDTNELVS